MKGWYIRSDDAVFKDGSKKREYHLVFETDSVELKERVEVFFKKLMDEKGE